MNALATLAAILALSGAQAQSPEQPSVKLAGRDVPITYPLPPLEDPAPEDYVNWSGWAFLPPSGRDNPGKAGSTSQMVEGSANWQPVLDRLAAIKDVKPTVQWHCKFFLFRRMDVLVKGDWLVNRRSTLEDPQIDGALKAVARFMQLARAASRGKIEIVPDVEIENEAVNIDLTDSVPWNHFPTDYASARVNGPGFEADDKVYRGPYQSVFLMEPALWVVNDHPTSSVPNGEAAEAEFIPIIADASGDRGVDLSVKLFDAWVADFGRKAREKGIQWEDRSEQNKDALGVLDLWAPEAAWPEVASSLPPTASELVAHKDPFTSKSSNAGRSVFKYGAAYHTDGVTASLVTDPDRGPVLRYTEKGFFRDGELASPGKETPLQGFKYLSFWVRTSTLEPLAVTLEGDRRFAVELGRNLSYVPSQDSIRVAIKADGQWQRVIVGIGSLSGSVRGIVIGPSDQDRLVERGQISPIVYDFDKFELLKSLTDGESVSGAVAFKPDFNSDEPEERLMALEAYAKSPIATDKVQALRLLADLNDTVRLNAVKVFGDLKDPDAEAGLAASATHLDARIDEAALTALAALNTDTAWATIRHALLNGVTSLAKMTAANLLASKKDPALAGPISVLLAQKDWQVRKAAAEAISQIPGREAAIIEMAFLQETNPAVRLAATKGADMSQEYVCGKVLYSSVNDASDAVRAWSDLKLISSPIESYRKEGYKGVRDDGREVRLTILKELAANPSENHRAALRTAVADTDPEVRAAALRAFAKLPGDVASAEIANTFTDKHPWVQEALLELARAKKGSVPKEALDFLAASPFPQVAAGAQELKG